MSVVKFWKERILNDFPPGIKIEVANEDWGNYLDADNVPVDQRIGGNLQDMYNFAAFTATCLNYLSLTNVGRTILAPLSNASTYIRYHTKGNSVGANQDISLNLVAHEILRGGKPGRETRLAAERMNIFKFLAEIRRQPRWDFVTNPSASATMNMHITDDELVAWIREGRLPSRLNQNDLEQLKLASISTLDPYSAHGLGSPSVIFFNINKKNENNSDRPAAIGLAHELIHAYYSLMGCQCGMEQGWTATLYEYKCVGLGRPWMTSAISENAIRAQWAGVPVPAEDELNHKPAGRRNLYD